MHRRGRLRALITDAWVPPHHPLHAVPGSFLQPLAERHNAALLDAPVHANTTGLLVHEALARLQQSTGWDRIMRRNQWFEEHAVSVIRDHRLLETDPAPVVFAYSYAAHDLFVEAKKHGATCVLGQIDAGPHEENIVAAEHARHPAYNSRQIRAPQAYWDRWRAECDLADVIIVNSRWSKQALAEAGIKGDHVRVVPLAYTAKATGMPVRTVPDAFTEERPLRILYLGTLTLRKGVARMIEAAHQVDHLPIELRVVGGGALNLPERAKEARNIRWMGRVPRSETIRHYRSADVFLFPTLSDGFGLTQLEAQSTGLPIIASKRCGDVVTSGVNGIELDPLTPEAIAEALSQCVNDPNEVRRMSENSPHRMERFAPKQVVDRLQAEIQQATSIP